MIHPDTEIKFISPEVGYGVVATRLIPAGTITWVLDKLDREFSPQEFAAMDELYQNILETYTFRNNQGNLILCWDHGRFVNHSFHSSCLTTAYDFEVAVRDILPGEELTDDYGYLNISHPFRAREEGSRRKIVYPDDLKRYSRIWDKQLTRVFPKIKDVAQPLLPVMKPEVWEEVQEVINRKKTMKSIFANYYEPQEQRTKQGVE